MAVLNEVSINLEEFISKGMEESLQQALEKACLIVENDAKARCPVDNGQLRNSITHEVKNTTGIIGTNVEYAPYVEIGTGIYSTHGDGRQDPWRYQTADGAWHTTSGQQAQPFLQPALESNLSQIKQCFEDII